MSNIDHKHARVYGQFPWLEEFLKGFGDLGNFTLLVKQVDTEFLHSIPSTSLEPGVLNPHAQNVALMDAEGRKVGVVQESGKFLPANFSWNDPSTHETRPYTGETIMCGAMRVPPLHPVKYVVFFDQVGHSFEPGTHITVTVRRPPKRFDSILAWYLEQNTEVVAERKMRVLHVECHDRVRKVVKEVLEVTGKYEITGFDDLSKAQAAAAQEEFDFFLCCGYIYKDDDVRKWGYELHKQGKKVIVLASSPQPSHLRGPEYVNKSDFYTELLPAFERLEE